MVFPPRPKGERTRGTRGCWSFIKDDSRWKDALKMRTKLQMKDKARKWIRDGSLARERDKRNMTSD